VAQFGSAPGLGPGGRRFESCHPDEPFRAGETLIAACFSRPLQRLAGLGARCTVLRMLTSALASLMLIFFISGAIAVLFSFVIVKQGTCAVITMFGKYRRVMQPGLNFRIPILEKVHQRVPVQNQALELQFQATTKDQANVNFTAMLLFTVKDSSPITIQAVAFKFLNQMGFQTALVRSIESAVRALVASKAQAEILGLRPEIVAHVKDELDTQLEEWGYHLLDLQVNDISFGAAIQTSMERVVAAQNERIAAENEGQALLIRETKRAEAEGAAIQIAARAEMEAARLRGQGVAAFRAEVASGMAAAAKAMDDASLDPAFILFSMWTETLRNVSAEGRGNLITFDGSVDGMSRTLRQMMALSNDEDGTAAMFGSSFSQSNAASLETLPPPTA
jgi:regulator of protease activity HflC (stomatin/prohibitin superfamily)